MAARATASIFSPTPEHAALRSMLRSFAEKEVEPQALKHHREEKFNIDLFRKLGDLGILGLTAPTQYGGSGMDVSTQRAVSPSNRLLRRAHPQWRRAPPAVPLAPTSCLNIFISCVVCCVHWRDGGAVCDCVRDTPARVCRVPSRSLALLHPSCAVLQHVSLNHRRLHACVLNLLQFSSAMRWRAGADSAAGCCLGIPL